MIKIDQAVQYRAYRRRWLQLFVFSLIIFINGIYNLTFSPITTQTTTFFNITTTEVNGLAIVFQFFYIVGTALSIWLYKITTLRKGMIVGAVLNLGVFIRLFALITPSKGYAALIIGQMFPATAAPIFTNIIVLFASRWFPPKQRDIATAIGSMANPLGLAIGSLLPSLIVPADSSSDLSHPFFILLIIEACLAAFSTILVILLFRSEPPTPPSPIENEHAVVNIKETTLNLLKNCQFMILLFSFSIGFALFTAIAVLLDQLVEPVGYTSDDAGVFGAVIIIVGILNSLVVGIIMDRTHAYRIILKILLVGACASSIYFILILQPHQYYPLVVSIGLMGFFLLPMLPVSFECAVECTYPIRAEWSTGLLLCVGNVLGGIFILIVGDLVTLSPLTSSGLIFTSSSLFILCCNVIAAVVLLTYRGPYLRLEAERNAFAEQNNDIDVPTT